LLRGVGAPVLSPDGRWVAYIVSDPPDTSEGLRTNSSDIWITDFEGKRPPRRYTFTTGNETSPRWSPDGQWIAFISERGGTRQLWRIKLAGGESEQITDFESGVGGFRWSPDGKQFAVTVKESVPARMQEERESGKDERVIDSQDRVSRLWIIDSSSGEGDPVTPDDLHIQEFAWSPDGGWIALIASDRPRSNEMYFHSRLELMSAADGSREILSENGGGTPEWSPDGGSIAFNYRLVHPEVTVGTDVIAIIGADGENLKLLGKKLRSTLDYPKWLAGEDKMAVMEFSGVRGRLATISLEDERMERIEDMLIPYYGGCPYDISRDGSRIALLKGSAQSPPDLYAVERGLLGRTRRLTEINSWLDERELPEAKIVNWTSRDGTMIEGVLFLPPGYEAGKTYPAVLDIHGGPQWAWWYGWHGTWHEWAIPLACRGFVVLLPNPRGSMAYGVGFARASFDDWGGGDYEDILAGADFLVDEGYADPDRIGITGWSYGGYMSSWAITQTRRFAAAVVGAGVTNLFSFHGTTDVTPSFLEGYFRDIAYLRSEAYREHSPIDYIRQAKTPTLVLHGEEDARVPVGQAYELYNGLLQVGVETEMVVYPREGHKLREIYHQIDVVERIVEWFERYIGSQ
jgi:dipeptidyl aminopeptidase/acylaminoacyl peptidase